jgi:hypothetical protein
MLIGSASALKIVGPYAEPRAEPNLMETGAAGQSPASHPAAKPQRLVQTILRSLVGFASKSGSTVGHSQYHLR